jgi:hypothetical protein
LLITLQAPSLPAEPRSALIIATSKYRHNSLSDLRAPAQDAADLSAVLRDPEYGGFAVSELLDKNKNEIEGALLHFLSTRQRGETALVYLSCHGLLSKFGELYFAAANTRPDELPTTALEARWLTFRLNECRARRQVVILDSCFSGTFIGSKGTGESALRGWLNGTSLGEMRPDGQGRIVLTASRGAQASWEKAGGAMGEGPIRSVFSQALIEGLRTGNADADHDGLVTAMEAYDYASDQVDASGQEQNPQVMFSGERRIYLVRSPRGVAPARLLHDPRPEIRITAVNRIAEWLDDPDPDRATAARAALQERAEQDIPPVSQAALAHLARGAENPAMTETAQVSAAETVAGADISPAATGVGAPKSDPRPRTRRWPRLAALIAIVAVAAAVTGVSIKIDLSRQGSTPSCRASTQPSFQQVTTLSGAAGTGLVICPVQVDHGQSPGLNVSVSGRILGKLPSGQLLTVVDQPDPASCATDGSPGTGGYYLVGTARPTAGHPDWSVTSPDYFSGAQSIQRRIYFLLGPESAVNTFAQAKDAYGDTHDGDVDSWGGKTTLAGFRVLGMLTFTPVQPANRYCKN